MPKKFWAFQPTAQAPDELDLLVYGIVAETEFWGDEAAAKTFREELDANPNVKKINVRVNSHGGDAFAGIAIHNILAAHPAEIVVIVEGIAASAAATICMAGRNRTVGGAQALGRVIMAKGTMMMVHNPSSYAAGDASELRRTATMLDKLATSMVAIYKAKCGKTDEEVRQMMDAETWMTAEEAVAAGCADEVSGEEVQVEARGDQVFVASVGFPADKLPERIRARASVQQPPGFFTPPPAPRPQSPAPVALTRELLAAQAPDLLQALLDEGHQAGLAAAPRAETTATAPEQPLDRAILEAKAPALLQALLAEGKEAGRIEGHAAGKIEGTAEERARLQRIDAVAKQGHEALIAKARYTEPITAEQLAFQIIQVETAKRQAYVADAGADAAGAALPPAPGTALPPSGASTAAAQAAKEAEEEEKLIKAAAEAGSAKRAGSTAR